MKEWKEYKKEKPPVGVEVLAYNHAWIDEDFCPKGIRIGVRMADEDFNSASWCDYYEEYVNNSRQDFIATATIPEKWISIDELI